MPVQRAAVGEWYRRPITNARRSRNASLARLKVLIQGLASRIRNRPSDRRCAKANHRRNPIIITEVLQFESPAVPASAKTRLKPVLRDFLQDKALSRSRQALKTTLRRVYTSPRFAGGLISDHLFQVINHSSIGPNATGV